MKTSPPTWTRNRLLRRASCDVRRQPGRGARSTSRGHPVWSDTRTPAAPRPGWARRWCSPRPRSYERLAVAFGVLMTNRGVPLIYYGTDRHGRGGDPQPRSMNWNAASYNAASRRCSVACRSSGPARGAQLAAPGDRTRCTSTTTPGVQMVDVADVATSGSTAPTATRTSRVCGDEDAHRPDLWGHDHRHYRHRSLRAASAVMLLIGASTSADGPPTSRIGCRDLLHSAEVIPLEYDLQPSRTSLW